MKFALFGDIHANLEALETVLEDAEKQRCTHYACIGDVVGYGANPNECLSIVKGMDCPVVKGNHDEEAWRDSPLEGLNPLAKAALEWTRDQLDDEEKAWLKDLRLLRQVQNFTVVHATLDSPAGWHYVTNKFDAMASFSYQFTSLCFYGHTHTPRVFVKSSSVHEEPADRVRIHAGNKYFINIGSVGQPRDGDWRSSYVTYDVEDERVTIRRLEYDLATAQKKIVDAGLPEMLATRLALGK
ncbi:MAG: metallophosphoesterase family protein [Verrucomicrobiota bacterium]